jgi:transposase
MAIVNEMNRAGKRAWVQRMRGCRTVAARVRYSIVLAWATGASSARAVAERVGCAPSTALRVAHRYLQEGETGLWDHRQANGRRKVSGAVTDALRHLIVSTPPAHGWSRPTWTVELLRRQLASATGVRLSLTTVRRLLRVVRARRKRPRPTVRCPWPVDQRLARCATLRHLWTHPPLGSVVLFEDEVDIHLNPKLGPDWMLAGVQKVVVTPGKNAKRYVAGALNAESGRLVWVSGERKTSALFLALLSQLPTCYPAATAIHLILDNFGIHSSKAVHAALATDLTRIRLHFLPPYCPTDNRIERVWLDLHANVTRNHTQPTIDLLLEAVHAYLTARNTTLRQQRLAA